MSLAVWAFAADVATAQGLRNDLITPLLIAGDDLVAAGIDDAGRVAGTRYEIEFFDNPEGRGIWERAWRWDLDTGIHFYSPAPGVTPQGRAWSEANWHGLSIQSVAPDGRLFGAVSDSYAAVSDETYGCPVTNIEPVVWSSTLGSPKYLAISNTPTGPLSPFDLRRYSYGGIQGDGKVICTATGGNAVLTNTEIPLDPCELRWRYTETKRESRQEVVTPGAGRHTLSVPAGLTGATATAANSRGERIGWGSHANAPLAVRGCYWGLANELTILALTGHEGIPMAINSTGEIAGIELAANASLSDPRGRLWLYLPTPAYELPAGHHYLTPAGTEAVFIAMNDRGGILYREVGTVANPGATRLWSSGVVRTYSALWTSNTWSNLNPVFLNRRGWIVALGTRISDQSLDYVLQRPWLELAISFAKTELQLCEETEMTATLTSALTSDLTGVTLVSPIQFAGDPALQIVSGPVPSLPIGIPGGAVRELKWKVRAVREGAARVTMQFRGDIPTTPINTQRMTSEPVTVTRAIIKVNVTGDAADFDPDDGCCDTDRDADGLQCTLRAAIQTANALSGEDTIHFDLPGGGVPRLAPATALPKLETGLVVDGATQPSGWVEVHGAALPSRAAVLELGGGVQVKGLVVNGSAQGFGLLLSGDGNRVTGCRIGTNAAGTGAVPNRWGITVSASGNEIGGAAEGAGNVLSGNIEYGVGLERGTNAAAVSTNVIQGNLIGTDVSGLNALPQKVGVLIAGGSANTVGGAGAARNVVSGNTEIGIHLFGSQAKDNVVEGNLVGLKRDASGGLGGDGFGMKIGIVAAKNASRNRIGGASPNVVGGCRTGIVIAEQAFENTVAGNLVGIVEEDSRPVPNLTGIWVVDGAANRIGGSGGSERNVVSGNKFFGIQVGAGERDLPVRRACVGTVVEENWIGVDRHGMRAVPNGEVDFHNDGGIALEFSADTTLVRRNVISGNRGFGVLVESAEPHQNALRSNHIGVLQDGVTPLGNLQPGVALSVFSGGGKAHCSIGGVQPGEGNLIAHNGECGVYLAGARFTATPTPVTGNLIYGSPKRAIALADRPPENDPGDADTGPNGLQNSPRLRGAANLDGQTKVLVDLKSFTPTTGVRIELFRHHEGDSSPSGDILLGTAVLLSGTAPRDEYLVDLPLQAVGTRLTATATTAAGATSEFSNAVRVQAGVDSDSDGVGDDEENAGSAARSAGTPAPRDRNGDGTPDAQQAHVASATWLDGTRATAVGPAGSTLSRPFVLERPGPLPTGLCAAGGAVGFTLTGQNGPTTVQLWIPSSIVPSSVLLRTGSSWTPVTILNNTIVGQLRCLDLRVAAPADGEWLFAFCLPCPPLTPPQIHVGAPIVVAPDSASLPTTTGFETGEAPAALPATVVRLLPVTVDPPPGPEVQLQSSTDLLIWLDQPAPPNPTTQPWQFQVSESTRFYRWQRD